MCSFLTAEQQDGAMRVLREHAIQAVFRYVSLHASPMVLYPSPEPIQLPAIESLSARLLAVSLYNDVTDGEEADPVDALVLFHGSQ